MLLIGLGIGALASQLGAVTVSAVPDDQSPEVGGVQNTATNLGASLGTALAGSFLIATLTTAFLANIQQSSAIPDRVKSDAQVQLAGGVPFISDADLEAALDEAHVSSRATDDAIEAYSAARIAGLRNALASSLCSRSSPLPRAAHTHSATGDPGLTDDVYRTPDERFTSLRATTSSATSSKTGCACTTWTRATARRCCCSTASRRGHTSHAGDPADRARWALHRAGLPRLRPQRQAGRARVVLVRHARCVLERFVDARPARCHGGDAGLGRPLGMRLAVERPDRIARSSS